MVTVSVNAFNDGDLLDNCLASITEHIPDARVQVVDGRYETFNPGGPENSTDNTPEIAEKYGAEYHAHGTYPREKWKHWHRLDLAPDDERVLFVDADERVLSFDADAIPEDAVGRVRIHNALMYGEGDVTYYPRWFYPDQMDSIDRVDSFSFDCAVEKTDAITFTHRADLRSDAYRDAKLGRFAREDREPWYKSYLEALEEQGHAADFETCPTCGRESVTRSRVCGYGDADTDEYTTVVTCTAADQCYAAIEPIDWDGEYRYVPDNIAEGFAEDLERTRLELIDAGNSIAKTLSPSRLRRYEVNARLWCEREFGDGVEADTNA